MFPLSKTTSSLKFLPGVGLLGRGVQFLTYLLEGGGGGGSGQPGNHSGYTLGGGALPGLCGSVGAAGGGGARLPGSYPVCVSVLGQPAAGGGGAVTRTLPGLSWHAVGVGSSGCMGAVLPINSSILL